MQNSIAGDVRRIEVDLYDSLSATGVGLGTDNSVVIGLMWEPSHSIDPDMILPAVAALKESDRFNLLGKYPIEYIWDWDMNLLEVSLSCHPNAMRLVAFGADGRLCSKIPIPLSAVPSDDRSWHIATNGSFLLK